MLGLIFFLGITATWVASLIKIPSILLLLTFGVIAGPVFNLIDPDLLFGNLLHPFISVSVGIILFEGGLTLKLSDIKEAAPSLARLLTFSALLTWVMASTLSYFLLPFSLSNSILLGSILIVTGPTVVGPLLHHIKPDKKLFSILHWEGILIDPIGALIATLVFEGVVKHKNSTSDAILYDVLTSIGLTILTGSALSIILAVVLIFLLRRFLIPDDLQNPVTLMFAITALILSNYIQPESGLFTVTLMGIILANQKKAPIHHIVEFKEALRVLLIATLFILLSSRITLDQLANLGFGAFTFAILLIVLVRPLSVFLALRKSNLSRKELVFLSSLAPRGIVAAAVASIFGSRIGEEGSALMPITFLVIALTVTIYGIGTPIIAKILKLSNSNPKRVLIVGANKTARAIAEILIECECDVTIVGSDHKAIAEAKMQDIPSVFANPLDQDTFRKLPLGEISTILILIPDEKESAIIAAKYRTVFSSKNIYQLPSDVTLDNTHNNFLKAGRIFANKTLNFYRLSYLLESPKPIRKTKITKEYSFSQLKKEIENKSLLLFNIDEDLNVIPADTTTQMSASVGDTLISIDLKKEDFENDPS